MTDNGTTDVFALQFMRLYHIYSQLAAISLIVRETLSFRERSGKGPSEAMVVADDQCFHTELFV